MRLYQFFHRSIKNKAMNFEKTENQKMIAQMVRDFAEKEIRPNVMIWDESQEFPVQLFKKLGVLGKF